MNKYTPPQYVLDQAAKPPCQNYMKAWNAPINQDTDMIKAAIDQGEHLPKNWCIILGLCQPDGTPVTTPPTTTK